MFRGLLAFVTASLLAGSTVPPAQSLVLDLPAPTGPHQIGVTALHLVDRTRTDPWDAKLGFRELMTTVFYPAADTHGYPLAPQMTPAAAGLFSAIDVPYLHPELPRSGVDWAATMTHAYTGAPAEPVRRPVVLYSPGFGDPRTLGTSVAEDLASHGYVVVTVDHPGETSEVELPGRMRTIKELPADPRTSPAVFRTMLTTRFADLRFTLDALESLAAGQNPDAEKRTLPHDLGRALDLRRVGMYGHGAGGAAATEALYEDRRVDAAADMDGYLDYLPDSPGQDGELLPVAAHGVHRAVLLLGTAGFRDARITRTWSALLAHRGGCTRWSQIDDAAHWALTDFGTEAPQLAAAGLMSSPDRNKLIGTIADAETVVRDRVLSFFDQHLRVS
ncbi:MULTISPECIES: alpha/beta hydrolase [Amycolatopsis]|uniref:Alpha/beta hydrolase n=1 Tax=Amycolatopsis dendrobii TaxID=2760662 RepID=A0A7W3VU19_9PSEU|nr:MULTISPECIES: alpha/beta hydrolase [Amycolatopsis]MBB1152872.1 alpha/beta hydrolase [Amycolatopsis dendrobii]UKD51959.1 alpha/beta hydrolase [Amycolatopsis sp. FU40]